jgi:AcrR family transcriptional regulator
MTSGQVRLRADAARNRAGIVQAARALIIARGAAVEMDEIAREAGVAVGTVYRHFPAKSDLTAAIAAELGTEILESLDAAVTRAEGDGCAGGELRALVRRVVVEAGTERLLRELSPAPGACLPDDVVARARDAVQHLISAAHRCGALSPDVSVDDLFLLLGTSPGFDVPESTRERWVELALRGLALRAADHLMPGASARAHSS